MAPLYQHCVKYLVFNTGNIATDFIMTCTCTKVSLKKQRFKLFNLGEDTKHLPCITKFLVHTVGGFAVLTYTIKENKRELLLCLWLVFEQNLKKKT